MELKLMSKLTVSQQALIELKRKHEKEISEMISKLEKEKSDSLTAIHNSLQAEKQVNKFASLHMYLSEYWCIMLINCYLDY